jgi:hypothetical protein
LRYSIPEENRGNATLIPFSSAKHAGDGCHEPHIIIFAVATPTLAFRAANIGMSETLAAAERTGDGRVRVFTLLAVSMLADN